MSDLSQTSFACALKVWLALMCFFKSDILWTMLRTFCGHIWFFVMNHCNMFLFICLLQNSYLYGLFSLWTDVICHFKWTFYEKTAPQLTHLNGGVFFHDSVHFIASRSSFLVKLESQALHFNGYFPSWTDTMCNVHTFRNMFCSQT